MPRAWSRKLVSAGPHISAACTIIDGGHAGDLRRVFRRVAFRTACFDLLPAGGVRGDEVAVDPAALDHDVQHAVEDADVAARAHRDEQIGSARDRRHARIEHDELRAVLARLPEIVGGDRRALGDVRAGDQNHLRLAECRSTDWRCGRCRRSSSTPRRRRPCRAGRCSRCSRCAPRRARTCPSGTPSRWSAKRRSGMRERVAAVGLPGCAGSRRAVDRAPSSQPIGSKAALPRRACSGASSRSGCSSCM